MRFSTLMPVALAVLAFAVYAPALGNGTVLDDDYLLGVELSPRQFFLDPGPPAGVPYYRPVTVSTYVALHIFSPGSVRVAAGHTTSLLLYAAAAAVFWLCSTLLSRHQHRLVAAFVATLLFTLHPLHTESVAWITARPDVLAGLFMIAALASYQRARETNEPLWMILAGLASLAAPLSKEVGAAIFVLLPAFEWLHVSRQHGLAVLGTAAPKRRARGRWQDLKLDRTRAPRLNVRDARVQAGVMLGAVLGAYLLLRLAVFHSLGSSDLTLHELRPKQLLGATGFYAERLLVPHDLLAFYAAVPTDTATIVSGLIAAAALVAALAFAIRLHGGAPAFGLIWIASTLLPSFPVFVADPSHAPLAERYLYLPSVGLAVCVAWLIAQALDHISPKRLALGRRRISPAHLGLWLAVLAIAVVFGVTTTTRLGDYADLRTFLEVTVRDSPRSGYPRAGLAAEYDRAGFAREAKEQFLIAINGLMKDSDRALAWDALATIQDREGDHAAAVESYQRGIALSPTAWNIHVNLAVTLWTMAGVTEPKDPELLASAFEHARLATTYASDRQDSWMLLARIARDRDDFATARAAYITVLRIDSSTAAASRANSELAQLAPGD